MKTRARKTALAGNLLFVKINPSRGHGGGIFHIISSTGHGSSLVYTVVPVRREASGLVRAGAPFDVYAAHCIDDMETRRLGIEERKARADKLGTHR